MTMDLQVSDVKCFGDTSGVVTVTGTGGALPYAYRADFKAFQATNVLTGLNAGPHVIRLRDNNGCYRDSNIVIAEPDKLIITSLDITHPTCEGFADGRISIAGTGGAPAYQYGLNGGFNGSPNKSNIVAGTYTVSIRDNNGCITDSAVTLVGYPVIVINDVSIKDVSCFGSEDGTITPDAEGGVQPLKYSIGAKLPDGNVFTGLKSDKYTLRITDDKGCIRDTAVSVGTPEKLVVSATANKNDCEGYDDGGTAKAIVEGGTLPYGYTWSTNPPRFNHEVNGLPNGNYRVIVIDANECTDSAITTIIYDNCCKTFVPDAFTPNNDGRNDKLPILFKGDLTLKVFSIFNRYGEVVFTTNNINQAWDGTHKGEPQDIGTYNYYIKAICGNGGSKEVEYKGTVTLIR